MKTISNKLYFATTLVLATVLVVSTSTQTMAIEAVINHTEKATTEACSRISKLASTSDATVTAHAASMKTDFANRISNLTSKHADVDQKASAARASIAVKFEAKITELKQIANLTTVQLTAIDTYATNMKAAELTRETAVDAARSTYRIAIAAAVNSHQQSLIDAAAVFEATTSKALATAKTDCGKGTAMDTLKQTVKVARQTLETARKSSSAGDAIKLLAETRNAAVKAANDAFSQSATGYKTTLTTALK